MRIMIIHITLKMSWKKQIISSRICKSLRVWVTESYITGLIKGKPILVSLTWHKVWDTESLRYWDSTIHRLQVSLPYLGHKIIIQFALLCNRKFCMERWNGYKKKFNFVDIICIKNLYGNLFIIVSVVIKNKTFSKNWLLRDQWQTAPAVMPYMLSG